MRYILFLILIYPLFLFSENINFSDSTYSLKNFIDGVEFKNPIESFFSDTIFIYPDAEPVNVDSLLCNYKYYLVLLYSPYVCTDCYNSNFNILNPLIQKYPEQVILLVEYWNLRDVDKGLKSLELNSNIQIFLNKQGRNIIKLSTLHKDLINAGFVIINSDLKIKYILMASFKYPFTKEIFINLISTTDKYLNQ